MFEMRFNWIPTYYRDQPMFGLMHTTSWSERKNHFFGQLTSMTLTLVEFVTHSDTAMDIQRYTHRTNQHKTRYTTPELLTYYVLKKEACEIYTRTIFYDIQEEICASITDCMSMSLMTIDGTHKFRIKEIGPEVSSLGLFEVLFTPSDVTLSCSCNRFERYGLLLRHSFYVLRICGVSEFPKRYVSRCWTRDAVTQEKRTGFDGRNKFNDEKLAIFQDRLQDIKSKVDIDFPSQRKMSDREVISSALGVSKPSKVKIRNLLQSKNKGDLSNSRIIPSKERAMTDGAKKGRKCNNCGDLDADHDSRNCPKPKKTLQQKSNMPGA
ncbi:FAR1 DNA binding domain, zinc finger, SWIM-type, MULE transposase domain containing protein [Tanacetum coccineum]